MKYSWIYVPHPVGSDTYISSLYWVQYEPTEYPNDPKGLQLALEYLRESYGDFPFYIEENGKYSFQVEYSEQEVQYSFSLACFLFLQGRDLQMTVSTTLIGWITSRATLEVSWMQSGDLQTSVSVCQTTWVSLQSIFQPHHLAYSSNKTFIYVLLTM